MPHSSNDFGSNDLALYTLLDDMRRYGVTASLAKTPAGIDQTFAAPTKPHQKEPPQKPAATLAPEKPVATAQKPHPETPDKKIRQTTPTPRAQSKPFDADACLTFQRGDLPFVVVFAVEDTRLAPLRMPTSEEQSLWQNMLKAIDIPAGGQQPSYLVVGGEAAMDGNLSEENEAVLSAATQKYLADNAPESRAVFAVGGRARRVLLGQNAGGTNTPDTEPEITLKKGCKCRLLTTYQLQAMLRQPSLKRQAWAALLELKEALSHA